MAKMDKKALGALLNDIANELEGLDPGTNIEADRARAVSEMRKTLGPRNSLVQKVENAREESGWGLADAPDAQYKKLQEQGWKRNRDLLIKSLRDAGKELMGKNA